jgi:hypothetical protein
LVPFLGASQAYSGACWIIARGIGHLACGNFVLHQ